MSHSFQNYDSHIILQELAKCNFKTSVLPKKIEKYMSFYYIAIEKIPLILDNTINTSISLYR